MDTYPLVDIFLLALFRARARLLSFGACACARGALYICRCLYMSIDPEIDADTTGVGWASYFAHSSCNSDAIVWAMQMKGALKG